MSEDQEDKTEQPSEKRLREARERGDVPRSRELGNVAVLGCAAMALVATGSGIGSASQDWLRGALTNQLPDVTFSGFNRLPELARTLAARNQIIDLAPLIGKYILPWFGGTPAVWTTCMLFFQVLLLGGYAYAHLLHGWLRAHVRAPQWSALVHLALLAAASSMLPIGVAAGFVEAPLSGQHLWVLGLFAASVGLPAARRSPGGSIPWATALRSRWIIGSTISSATALSNSVSPPRVTSSTRLPAARAIARSWGARRW